MIDQSLGLTDDEFWSDPMKTWNQIAGKLRGENPSGIFLGAPAKAATDIRTTLPGVTLRFGTYADVAALNFDRRALLVAVNLDENRVLLAHAVPQQDLSPLSDPADAPEGSTASSEVIDLRERLDLPWKPASYLVTIVMRDRLSNRAKIKLEASAATYQDPEVVKLLEAAKAKVGPPAVSPLPGDPLPSYKKRDDSPPIPEKPGIALAVDRVFGLKPDAPCVLRGAFRLPALSREIVKEPAAKGDPTAIVGVTILVVGADLPGPGLLRLDVPCFDPIPKDAKDPVATGYFALDLFEAKLAPRIAQTLFVYAFAGEALTGPIPVALVSPDMIPK